MPFKVLKNNVSPSYLYHGTDIFLDLYIEMPKSNLFLEVFRNLVRGDKNFVKLQHAEKRFELGERDLLRA